MVNQTVIMKILPTIRGLADFPNAVPSRSCLDIVIGLQSLRDLS